MTDRPDTTPSSPRLPENESVTGSAQRLPVIEVVSTYFYQSASGKAAVVNQLAGCDLPGGEIYTANLSCLVARS